MEAHTLIKTVDTQNSFKKISVSVVNHRYHTRLAPFVRNSTTMMMISSVVSAILFAPSGCTAFNTKYHQPSPWPWRTHLHSSTQLNDDVTGEATQLEHPHSLLWSTTLKTAANSYVHPSVQLAIRPPSEGGTGIIATDDIPSDTIAMCLPLEEVGMIDAASILDSPQLKQQKGQDAVMDMLSEMWNKEFASVNKSKLETQEGRRLAVLAGLIAHLQLTRYKDLTAVESNLSTWNNNLVKEIFALDESRRLGLFLDAMPLLPQHSSENNHPFPTHFLYWADDEIQYLLQGTIAQTKAREVRAGVGLVIREWSAFFLKEHSESLSQTQILNAIFSAFTSVLSRSFGDAAGRDLDGKGRMLVPLVDMLNHDGEQPNVSWKWHVGEGDDEMVEGGRGDIVVRTLLDVKKGDELVKCYGWRPSWDIASSYGFVPQIKDERFECSAIPLFPAILDLSPHMISSPTQKTNGDTSLDLSLEINYGPLVKAVIAAVDGAKKVEAKLNEPTNSATNDSAEDESDRPPQLQRLEIVSLFRPAPSQTAKEFPFDRRQPCVVVGTKISSSGNEESHHHKEAIEAALPSFRAAASAISQLQRNYEDGVSSPIKVSLMLTAAASLDGDEWDILALDLMRKGIEDRTSTLLNDGKAADTWCASKNNMGDLHQQCRAGVARDVRDAELKVLRSLEHEILRMLCEKPNNLRF